MRKKYLLIGAVVIVAAVVGLYAWYSIGDAADLPNDPDELTLFSIDGKMHHTVGDQKAQPKDQELLYQYPVLGRVDITDPNLRRRIMASVKQDIRSGAVQNKCFEPRHVLRVKKGGSTIDMVICFKCHNYSMSRDGGPLPGITPSIGARSQQLLNNILNDAGVPLAP
ncbi:MAG TPA: hypothetical protein VG097_13425 [Gemmata sp.]|nr:hypothetical protein [Gemmata sp.]